MWRVMCCRKGTMRASAGHDGCMWKLAAFCWCCCLQMENFWRSTLLHYNLHANALPT